MKLILELLDDWSHINGIFQNTSVVPFSNFVDFVYSASRICLGQNVKALVFVEANLSFED